MTNVNAELHSHSTFSDGSYTPEQVAQMCAGATVQVWALTDHDTCAGCERAAAAAQSHGIEFIPGIEVSAYEGRSVHVLGYGVDPDARTLREFSERRVAARFDRMRQMVEKLERIGVPVDYEDVVAIAGEGSIARPHLARALVAAGHVDTLDEAFQRYISPSGPAYISTTWPTVPIAIDIIRESGGVAVLAHPGIYGRDEDIPAWIQHGLVGVEAGHPKHSRSDEARYRALAAEHRLLATSSSDFHGPDHISTDYFGKTTVEVEILSALRGAIEAA